jgi:CBS domain-containing protein
MSAVSEIMTSRKVVTVGKERNPSMQEIATLMVKNRVGSVIIVDQRNRPLGIITERDVLKKSVKFGKGLEDIAANTSMSSPVISVRAYDSLDTAAEVMHSKKIKRLLVLEQDGSLAGILSVTDIARKLARILTDEYNRYAKLKALLES